MEENKTVMQFAYHRNGVCGQGFYVGIVKDEAGRDMLVVRFPKESDKATGAVHCAAFDLAQLDKREIAFGLNSWRGDHYSDAMDEAIDAREKADTLYYEMEAAYRDLQSA